MPHQISFLQPQKKHLFSSVQIFNYLRRFRHKTKKKPTPPIADVLPRQSDTSLLPGKTRKRKNPGAFMRARNKNKKWQRKAIKGGKSAAREEEYPFSGMSSKEFKEVVSMLMKVPSLSHIMTSLAAPSKLFEIYPNVVLIGATATNGHAPPPTSITPPPPAIRKLFRLRNSRLIHPRFDSISRHRNFGPFRSRFRNKTRPPDDG